MRLRLRRLPGLRVVVAGLPRRFPRGPFRPGARTRTKVLLLPALLLGAVVAVVPLGLTTVRPSLQLQGLAPDAVIGKSALDDLRVLIEAGGAEPGNVRVSLDGERMSLDTAEGTRIVDLRGVSDGQHTLSVAAEAAFGLATTELERRFTVDTTPPELDVPGEVWTSSFTDPFTFDGRVAGATRVSADGQAVEVRDGGFTVRGDDPPATVELAAADAAGNTARETVTVGVEHPGMRAVHMTAVSWNSDAIREPVLDMIEQGKIDTVELDIKDESGQVGYDSEVPLAEKIDADKGHYDAAKVIDKLHDMGVRVVGRLVCFRDPVLAEAAWTSGKRERVVQTPGGKAYAGGYGEYAFTNFANETVRQYNIDLAVEAAKLGFDDILYDYIRRPDGRLDSMVFPGLETTPSASIADFVEESSEPVHTAGAFVGVSVFGIAATRPESVAQDIPQIADHADYIAPMVYPSHWGPGEYGVARPNSQPHGIVQRSLQDFRDQVDGTGAVVIPWLQDFSLGVGYGADEVRAQIEAAQDAGIDAFLLWSPGASYTSAALSSPE